MTAVASNLSVTEKNVSSEKGDQFLNHQSVTRKTFLHQSSIGEQSASQVYKYSKNSPIK